MNLLNTHNQKTTVSRSVHNYLIRKSNESCIKYDESPQGKVKAKDINGIEHEFNLETCFNPIYEHYKEAARIKHMELIKPKSYRYGRYN